MFRDGSPTLAGLFERHVDTAPTRTALVADGLRWSYAELDARADRLAGHLADAGLRPGAFAGVCTDRRADLVVTALATLKLGAVYVPLDVSYPPERLAWMAGDAGLDLVVTRAPHDTLLPWDGLPVVRLDADAEAIAARPATRPDGRSAAQPACMMYTSGSTGRPKGVLTTQKAVIRLVVDTCWLRMGPGERVGSGGNLSFDASVLEIWMALLNGACLVAIERDVMTSPRHLARFVREQRLTTVFVTTSLFNEVVRAEPAAFATVPQLLIGGEAADPGSVRTARRHLPPGGRLLSGYGPTEASTFSTVHDTADLPPEAGAVPIGTPIDRTALYVLDEELRPVPDGTPGELYIGGDGVSDGYWRRPDRTAAAFLPDPFAGGGARMYRSGDRVTRRPDGVLEFGGRLDGQVKIRGFRIELGEVEEALRSHPAVAAAVATVREDRPGDRRLVGYIVPAGGVAGAGGGALGEDVRAYCRERLPAQLVPAAVVTLDRVPLNPNGKADRRALPAPVAAPTGTGAPRDPVEETIARLWADALGVPGVATDRDFFDLGGHSLIATQVVARIRETYQVELPMRLMFEGRTVAQLAEAVRRAQAESATSPATVPTTGPVPRRDPAAPALPSYGEEQFLFLDELRPGNAAYNNAFAYRLRGPLDPDRLRHALTALAARHEALRTSYRRDGETHHADVAEPSAATLPLRVAPPHDPADEDGLRALLRDESFRPFDLGAAPLLRALLVPLGADDHVLQLTVHEIVADAWSLRVLFEDLSALYAGDPLPAAPPVGYRDIAQWQRARLADGGADGLADQLTFWRERLADAPEVLPLPTDRPRPATQSFHGGTHHFTLDAGLVADAEALAREHEASLFMVLLGAVDTVLHRWTGRDDLVVGAPVAGRLRPELDRTVGFFVNTLPLRTSLDGDPAFTDLLGRVRETALAAFAHQEVPFERLTAELAPQRAVSHSPLVQVVLSLHAMPGEGLTLPGVRNEPLPSDFSATQFDVTFTLERRPGGEIAGAVVYSTDLFDAATAERLAGHLVTVLRGAVAAPHTRLSALPLLTPGEHAELRRLNATERRPAPGQPRLLHESVEAQARATPDATALVHEGTRLTYAELNARANRLAHHLIARGVGPERVVALVLERGIDMPVAILATLKAGGAYLPVDPAYPRERRDLMLEHSRAAVVLTGALPDTSGLPDDDPRVPVLPENPAYVIYTSGSTGRPKGVVIPHAGVVNLITDPHYDALVPRGCRAAVWASFSFDASVYALFPALARGAEVHLTPERARVSPEDHLDWLVEHGIESTFLAPYMLPEAARRPELPLRGLSVGAEAVPAAAVRRLSGRLRPDCRVVNAYGPTEASVSASMYAVPAGREDAPPGAGLPIGRALGNVRLHVLDAAGALVPAGVTGELWIAGEGLARGYLHDPAQTADRFRPDPYGPPGTRMYRTGDLAYRRADGDLVFAGRADDQIALRGLRVEPGEVEAALTRHPAVTAAHVTVRDGGLVGYLAAPEPDALDLDALRAAVAAAVPRFMVPGRLVVLPELPLSPNGKLDPARLPEPPGAAGVPEGRAPRTATERAVAGLWGELLGVPDPSAEDRFFQLGGDSLKAARLARRLSRVRPLPVPLLLQLVMEQETLGGLAAAVDAALGAGPERAPSGPALRPAARRTLADLLAEGGTATTGTAKES